MKQEEIEQKLEKAFLTIKEVMEILEVSRGHVYNLMDVGKLEAIDISAGSQINSMFRIKSSSVRKLLGLDKKIEPEKEPALP